MKINELAHAEFEKILSSFNGVDVKHTDEIKDEELVVYLSNYSLYIIFL